MTASKDEYVLFTGDDIRQDPILQYFIPNPNLQGEQRNIAEDFAIWARNFIDSIPRNPERTVGLRKLLEAKDCFIRATL